MDNFSLYRGAVARHALEVRADAIICIYKPTNEPKQVTRAKFVKSSLLLYNSGCHMRSIPASELSGTSLQAESMHHSKNEIKYAFIGPE
jgi:hypothetical protein